MIKILHLITDLNIGGAEMMLQKLVSNMNGEHYENIVVSIMDKGSLGEKIEKNGVRLYTLDMKKGISAFSGIIKLFKIIKSEKPDIIQTWLYHADMLGLICGKLSGMSRICWNLRCSNMEMSKYSFISGLIVKMLSGLSRLPTAVLYNSLEGKKVHEKIGYRPLRWEYIPNGFNPEVFTPSQASDRKEFRQSMGIPEDAFIIGMIARYDPMKGHKELVHSAKLLSDKCKSNNIYFVLAGRGVDKNNKELLIELKNTGAYENFILLGERKDIPYLTSNFDILCSPSLGEGFSNSIGEAMSCQVPCVVTAVGDSPLIVEDSGIVVSPGDSEALAEALYSMYIMKPEERNAMGVRARDIILNKYSIKVIVNKYEVLYKNLCI